MFQGHCKKVIAREKSPEFDKQDCFLLSSSCMTVEIMASVLGRVADPIFIDFVYLCVVSTMPNFFVAVVDRSYKGQKELNFVRKTCI